MDSSMLPVEKREEKCIDDVVNDHAASIQPVKKGRRKIEIKKIEKKSNRQVTFSKRRVGLFKKASELCILTGAEIAILVRSKGKKIFSFGQPNLERVIHHYSNDDVVDDAEQDIQNTADNDFDELVELCKQLELEKQQKVEVSTSMSRDWWNYNVNGMSVVDLEVYLKRIEDMKNAVNSRNQDLEVMKSSKSLNLFNA